MKRAFLDNFDINIRRDISQFLSLLQLSEEPLCRALQILQGEEKEAEERMKEIGYVYPFNTRKAHSLGGGMCGL